MGLCEFSWDSPVGSESEANGAKRNRSEQNRAEDGAEDRAEARAEARAEDEATMKTKQNRPEAKTENEATPNETERTLSDRKRNAS